MGKLFKQNFLYEFVRRTIYSGESQFKTSSIFTATVFNATFSLFYPWKFCFLSGCLLNSPHKNTDSHFANSASAIELCDFFRGNYYSALTGISKHGSCVFYLGTGFFKFILLDVLLCSITEYFYSLFVFWLALWARQNTTQLVKILGDTTHQQNV